MPVALVIVTVPVVTSSPFLVIRTFISVSYSPAVCALITRAEATTVASTASVDVPVPGSSPAPGSRSLPPHAAIERIAATKDKLFFMVTPAGQGST